MCSEIVNCDELVDAMNISSKLNTGRLANLEICPLLDMFSDREIVEYQCDFVEFCKQGAAIVDPSLAEELQMYEKQLNSTSLRGSSSMT